MDLLVLADRDGAITRQQCRVRIETGVPTAGPATGSSITRQQCRVRIETCSRSAIDDQRQPSPGSNAGCGLKLPGLAPPHLVRHPSPGSNAGCGLKLFNGAMVRAILDHHPAAMPGAD